MITNARIRGLHSRGEGSKRRGVSRMMGVILGTDTRHDFIQGMELCIHVGHLGCHNTNGAIMD